MYKVLLFLSTFTVILISCAKVIDSSKFKLSKNKAYAVIPFENYTNTPLAGYRVASMVEGILRAKGYVVIQRTWEYRDEEPTKEEIYKIKKSLERKVSYIIMGTVNEYEYKVGVDGDPVVSITLNIYDTGRGEIVESMVLSAKGSARESLGTLTQKLLREVF